MKNELRELREANKGLDTTKFSQEKSITEYALRIQSLHRELEDKEQLSIKANALLDATKASREQVEQALADERAKTAKMHDKLLQSKAEIEGAEKAIERVMAKYDLLKGEKKSQKSKIKVKNAVVLQ